MPLSCVADLMFKNLPTIYGNEVKAPDGVKLVMIPDIEEISSTTGLINKIQSAGVKSDIKDDANKHLLKDVDTPEYGIEFFGEQYRIQVGSTIMFETPFDDALRKVVRIEEVFDDDTKMNELIIYTDKGKTYRTRERTLCVKTSGCYGKIYAPEKE